MSIFYGAFMKINNFAEKLDSALKRKGLKQTQLAEMAGLTDRHISRVKKSVEIPESFLKKICIALNISLAELVGTESIDGDYYPVPFRAACGGMGGGHFDGSKKIKSFISMRRDFLLTKTSNLSKISFIRAEGESMSPTIPPDASVLIDESQIEPINNKIYFLMLNGVYFIKRLEVKNGKPIAIISDNWESKQKLNEADNIEILGRALFMIAEL